MKLTTTTFVSVDGVMQGIRGPDEDRSGAFERGGWTTPLWDQEGRAGGAGSGTLIRWLLDNDLVDEINLFLFPVVVGQGTPLFPDTGPDLALELVESQATPNGVTSRSTGAPGARSTERPRPT